MVVESEVRNLAGRSAKAAQETSELIVGSSKLVEAGVEVSNQAREAFDKIADDIAQVTDLVGKILSDEQAILSKNPIECDDKRSSRRRADSGCQRTEHVNRWRKPSNRAL